jgi:hypothetical protein
MAYQPAGTTRSRAEAEIAFRRTAKMRKAMAAAAKEAKPVTQNTRWAGRRLNMRAVVRPDSPAVHNCRLVRQVLAPGR